MGRILERIVDGVRYEGTVVPDCWDVSIFEVAGHREISARNAVSWQETTYPVNAHREGDGYLGEATAAQVAKWAAQDAADAAEQKEADRKKSAAKAKSRARRFMKEENFDEMLTLTYRENIQDYALSQKHFKEWVRRMKRALGAFRYCAGWEPQDRGAIHWHVATNKLPKLANYKGVKVKAWEVGTKIWRDIVGTVEVRGPMRPGVARPVLPGGLCFVGGKPRDPRNKRRRNMSIAKIAAYVSKYILKNCLDRPDDKNRYSRSNSRPVMLDEVPGPLRPGEKRLRIPTGPVKHSRRLHGLTIGELIGQIFQCADGDTIVSHRIGPHGDSYWLVTEPLTALMRFSQQGDS